MIAVALYCSSVYQTQSHRGAHGNTPGAAMGVQYVELTGGYHGTNGSNNLDSRGRGPGVWGPNMAETLQKRAALPPG